MVKFIWISPIPMTTRQFKSLKSTLDLLELNVITEPLELRLPTDIVLKNILNVCKGYNCFNIAGMFPAHVAVELAMRKYTLSLNYVLCSSNLIKPEPPRAQPVQPYTYISWKFI